MCVSWWAAPAQGRQQGQPGGRRGAGGWVADILRVLNTSPEMLPTFASTGSCCASAWVRFSVVFHPSPWHFAVWILQCFSFCCFGTHKTVQNRDRKVILGGAVHLIGPAKTVLPLIFAFPLISAGHFTSGLLCFYFILIVDCGIVWVDVQFS